jgi:predicted anti-sigma-YlaC factor YlaD
MNPDPARTPASPVPGFKIRLSCQEVSRLLSERLDTSLPAAERARLRLHLVMCPACRSVGEQMDLLRQAMRHLAG